MAWRGRQPAQAPARPGVAGAGQRGRVGQAARAHPAGLAGRALRARRGGGEGSGCGGGARGGRGGGSARWCPDCSPRRARVAGVEARREGRRAVDAARERDPAARAGHAAQARERRVEGPHHGPLRRPPDRRCHDARGVDVPARDGQSGHVRAQRQRAPRRSALDLRLRDEARHVRAPVEPGGCDRQALPAAPAAARPLRGRGAGVARARV